MVTSFAELKKFNRDVDMLSKELEKFKTGKQNFSDDRFWKPTLDKAKNGFATFRFLPAPPNEDMPFVRYWDHGFKGKTGMWYIEKSLTSIGQPDPLSEYNSELWNSGIEANKEIARKQKRREKYVSNIYMINDPANPENNGKVFLYQYGKKIFEKLNEAMNPQFPDEKPFNPFDFWTGANFNLKIRDVEGYSNYDRSVFAEPGSLFDEDDEKYESIWNSQYSLQEFVDPKNYKSYDELKTKLYKVLALGEVVNDTVEREEMDFKPSFKEKSAVAVEEANDPPWSNDDDEEDGLSFFQKLANEED